MKIKKISNSKFNLFKLNLIQSKIYKTKSKKFFTEESLNTLFEQLELQLKKILQIIYEYHINNKQILFIGVPNLFQLKLEKILVKTNHLLIPESLWINGILSNKDATFSNLKLKRLKNIKKQKLNTNEIDLLLRVVKKPDLIIIFDRTLDSNAIEEICKLRIPLISFNNNLYFDPKSTYKFSGNFKKSYFKVPNLFIFLLQSVFKRPLKKTSIK